jgi:glutathione peroxidase
MKLMRFKEHRNMTQIDYSTRIQRITGEETDLKEYQGKVLLIVNTASKCGFTPQYEGLEALWQRLRAQGLVVLGFPCDQFAHQEPATEAEIADFCRINYGVTFPLYAKIKVNGPEAHPLYQELSAAAPGLLGSKAIKWNFTKFLVDREGNILKRFSPQTKPEELEQEIQNLL